MLRTTIGGLWLLCAVLPLAARAQTVRWGGEADVNSRYVWRGFTYSQGPVFQPSVWGQARGFTFTAWSNLPLSDEPRQGQFDQLFWTATRSRQWRRWTLEGTLQGYFWQGPPGQPGARTVEAAGRVAYARGPVELFTAQAFDLAAYRGSYWVEVGAGWQRTWHRVQWAAQAEVGLANARFNHAYAGVSRPAVNCAQFDLSASIPLRRGWFIRPHAEFTQLVSPALRRAVTPRRIVNAGVAVGWSF